MTKNWTKVPFYIRHKLNGLFKSKSSKDMSSNKRVDRSKSDHFGGDMIYLVVRSLSSINLTHMTSLSAPVSLARLVEPEDGGIWKGPDM